MVDRARADVNDHGPRGYQGDPVEQEWDHHKERSAAERSENTVGQGGSEHNRGRMVPSPPNCEPCIPP